MKIFKCLIVSMLLLLMVGCNKNDNNSTSDENLNKEQNIISATQSYSCDDDSYTLDADRCKKIIYTTPNMEYSCPSGYNKEGKSCSKSTQNKITVDIIKTPVCPTGYKLNGSRCEMEHEKPAHKILRCPPGLTLKETGCYKRQTTTVAIQNINDSWAYSIKMLYYKKIKTTCDSHGGQVIKINNQWRCSADLYYLVQAAIIHRLYCDADYSLSGTKCYKTQISDPEYQNTCPSGYTLSTNNCYKFEYTVKTIAATEKYTCPSEYTLSDDKCIKETSVPAIEVYTCPKDYALKGAACYKN